MDTEKFLQFLLLDFYERTSLSDLQIRHAWCLNVLLKNRLDHFEKLCGSLHREIESLEFLFRKNVPFEVPLTFDGSATVNNNLAIAFYFRLIMLDYRAQESIQRSNNVMSVKEYSAAVSSGKYLIIHGTYRMA